MSPLSTSDAKDVTDKSVRKVYIKSGKRKMMSSDGTYMMSQREGRKMFGKHKGGKYSKPR